VRLGVPARLLPQRLDLLDGAGTIAQNVAGFAPQASVNAIRANLARLLFPGSRADQVVATLSGGELFRATLAALLLADPAPRLRAHPVAAPQRPPERHRSVVSHRPG
jgi:ATPase subunit of ABC transporter with duplicated ATPase domains